MVTHEIYPQRQDLNLVLLTQSADFSPLLFCLGEGNGTPLQYSCLENPMDGGAWWAAVRGVAKSRTLLSDFTFTFHFSLSRIGEGNGNPLHGVAQSRTRLKRLSSSSSSSVSPQRKVLQRRACSGMSNWKHIRWVHWCDASLLAFCAFPSVILDTDMRLFLFGREWV